MKNFGSTELIIPWLGRQDSNLRMTGPKPVALPLGYDPLMYAVGARADGTVRRVSEYR
jgi:hypothetical protein